MKNNILKMITFLIIIFLLLSGCNKNATQIIENKEEKRLNVYASFYPYYDFAKRIGGEC